MQAISPIIQEFQRSKRKIMKHPKKNSSQQILINLNIELKAKQLAETQPYKHVILHL